MRRAGRGTARASLRATEHAEPARAGSARGADGEPLVPGVLQGRTVQPRLFKEADDKDADFNGAVADPAVVEEAFAAWKAEIRAADEWLDALDEDGLGRHVPFDEDSVSIRDVLVHVVEEYARHAGHADLLRECIDGRTGQ